MKKKIEQEEAFFSQVEEVLQSHEDTYEVGAWEEFVAIRKKNKRKWPIYAWTAAAIVLLLLSFGLFELAKRDQLQESEVVVKNEHKQPNLNSNAGTKTDQNQIVDTDHLIAPESIITQADPIIAAVEQSTQPKQPENPWTADPVAVAPKDATVPGTLLNRAHSNAPVLAGAYDSLMNRDKVVALDEKSAKKLTYSLVVAPSISNQKINFGAGMELSYKLGQHLSVSSGLMYTSIGAKSDGNSLVAFNKNRGQDANLAVRGIELPLGIQYQTKSGFYASAGVSALGLIKDKLEYSYLAERMASVTQTTNTGATNEVYIVVNEKQTGESIEPLNNYMGFFNFSAGKKQAFGDVNLNIGPFIKVPFSSVSSEKIKLLQGGVKISIDF